MYKHSSVAENIVQTLKVHLFTTKVIKSHVKLHMKSNATKIPRRLSSLGLLVGKNSDRIDIWKEVKVYKQLSIEYFFLAIRPK